MGSTLIDFRVEPVQFKTIGGLGTYALTRHRLDGSKGWIALVTLADEGDTYDLNRRFINAVKGQYSPSGIHWDNLYELPGDGIYEACSLNIRTFFNVTPTLVQTIGKDWVLRKLRGESKPRPVEFALDEPAITPAKRCYRLLDDF